MPRKEIKLCRVNSRQVSCVASAANQTRHSGAGHGCRRADATVPENAQTAAARPFDLKLYTHVLNGTSTGTGNTRKQRGDEGFKISETVRGRTKNNDCDREGRQILLKGKIAINSDEYLELARGECKQFPVLDSQPPHLARGLDLVTHDVPREAPVNTLIDKYFHATAAATRRSFACSRKRITCPRSTDGNPARKSSIDSPASR